MTGHRGATPQEWTWFDFELGLAGNLLPVVCDPNPTPAPGSKIKKWGKVPSAYNAQGQAHGIKDWQSRPLLSNELQLWRQDPRLGICVRTGSCSGVYAIDVDVADPAMAQQILEDIFFLGEGYRRTRSNSPKFLVPIRLTAAYDKRIINTKHGRIELLGEGQQFLAAGTHTSGERYVWTPEMPPYFPALNEENFEVLWGTLEGTYGIAGKTSTPSAHVVSSLPNDNTLLTSIDDDTAATLATALMHPRMLADGVDNDFWSEVGYALLSLGNTGKDLFHDYSRLAPNFEPAASDDWWDSHRDQTPRTDYRHIFTLARARGWGATASTDSFEPIARSADAVGGVDPLDIELAPPPRPTVRLVEGQFPNIARQLSDIISPQVFKQSSTLVRIGTADNVADGIRRDKADRPLLHISQSFMRVILGDAADFVKFDARAGDWRVRDCPPDLATAMLTLGEWPNIRQLDAIARAPFIRLDGTVCDVEGYDAASRVLYMPNAEFPKLPDVITREMALASLDTLLEPFHEFPYKNSAAKSAFAAHILTEAARAAIRTSPMFWYSAPNAGTGKSLLSEMPGTVVHGVQPAVRPWVSESEEVRKTLFASLVAGDRSIMFDNVPNGYKARSPDLCAFLTSPVWKDRKLGASEMVELPNRAVLSASGNNVTPVADMARRSLVVRLDANSTQLKQRTFQIDDLRAYVLEHRTELLTAALTIIAGWQQNKTKRLATPLPSFEDWSSMVRDPLLWLGMTDPIETQEEETDDETDALEKAFAALGDHFAGREFTSPAVCNFGMGFSDTDGSIAQMMVEAGCQEPTNQTKVGYWLRDCRDKIGGGYKLVRIKSDGKHPTRWEFKHVNGNEDLV